MEFNPDQFTQNSLDGFGERKMREYRVRRPTPPTSQPAPSRPPTDRSTGWHQSEIPISNQNARPPGHRLSQEPATPSQSAHPAPFTDADSAAAVAAYRRGARNAPQAGGTAAPGASSWSQPALPDPPAAPATPARPARLTPAAQARTAISAAHGQGRDARVATAQANAQSNIHRQSVAEDRAVQNQRRAAASRRTRLAGHIGGPVHGPPTQAAARRSQPSSAVTDLTPPGPPATPAGPGRQTQINHLAYRNQSQRLGPPPTPPDPPTPSGPSHPQAPNTPPAPPAAQPSRISPGMARAGRHTGAGVFLAAKALQSVTKPATDPKRSGNPLYKTSKGWTRS